MGASIVYKRASSDDELQQILEIQKRNFKVNLSEEDQQLEGFITVHHSFETLKKMNTSCAHIIAKDGNTVAGYALAMLPSFREEFPVLVPMFETADELLKGRKYIVMGQVCIDRPYRKQGIFRGLYGFYREELKDEFDCLFTEVASSNIRSLEAHKSVGFKVLKTQTSDGVSWELINWEWREEC
ncbi:GNAT family N-acetyltransferase [Leptobacterium flavescens]|uniref:GNAT family N-acetyltransferase n=1 Tax=Leptobacterium flavescens TaxID=472055 RepID=A0A6P0UPS0_9FLAO|nr:GNAT family N-acetyltransferase [Leptobacterium flavescens]NER14502.1 GNAT family N-acetyltransferase [Leptobacterium flavescens]